MLFHSPSHFFYLSYKKTLTIFRSKPFHKFKMSPPLMLTQPKAEPTSSSKGAQGKEESKARGEKGKRGKGNTTMLTKLFPLLLSHSVEPSLPSRPSSSLGVTPSTNEITTQWPPPVTSNTHCAITHLPKSSRQVQIYIKAIY